MSTRHDLYGVCERVRHHCRVRHLVSGQIDNPNSESPSATEPIISLGPFISATTSAINDWYVDPTLDSREKTMIAISSFRAK